MKKDTAIAIALMSLLAFTLLFVWGVTARHNATCTGCDWEYCEGTPDNAVNNNK